MRGSSHSVTIAAIHRSKGNTTMLLCCGSHQVQLCAESALCKLGRLMQPAEGFCCGAARRSGHSLRLRGFGTCELTQCRAAAVRVISGNDASAVECCLSGNLSGLTGYEKSNRSAPKRQQGFHETYPLAKIADRSLPAVRQMTGRTFNCFNRSVRGHLLRVKFYGKI